MIHDPVLIIGCARSGTTLLYNLLSEVPSLWSIGFESKAIIERYHHPRSKGWVSGALEAGDLTPESRAYILSAFEREAASGHFWRDINRLRARLRGNPFWGWVKGHGQSQRTGSAVSSTIPQAGLNLVRAYVRMRNSLIPGSARRPIRLLEKTPENCLRLPFLLELFPDARVIYLVRDGRANIGSLMEGWRHPHLFNSYRLPAPLRIPGLEREWWAFTLIPGWQDLLELPLEEVCAWQWIRCNEAVLAHREQFATGVPYLTVRYEDLVGRPGEVLARIAGFIEVDFDAHLSHFTHELPRINVVSAPDRNKWRRIDPATWQRIAPIIAPMMRRLGYTQELDGEAAAPVNKKAARKAAGSAAQSGSGSGAG